MMVLSFFTGTDPAITWILPEKNYLLMITIQLK